jgi:hypothetical protein
MLLNLPWIHILSGDLDTWSGIVRPLVHVGEEEGGADSGAIVEAGAAISMAASPDLEVEGAVHSVFLGTKDGSQVLRHRYRSHALSVACSSQKLGLL